MWFAAFELDLGSIPTSGSFNERKWWYAYKTEPDCYKDLVHYLHYVLPSCSDYSFNSSDPSGLDYRYNWQS